MHFSRTGTVFCSTFLLIGCLSACNFSFGGKIDSKKVEDAIRSHLETSQKGRTFEVSCPSDIKPSKGALFDCTVKSDGHTMQANVTQTDDKGTVTWQVKGLVNLLIKRHTEKHIEGQIANQLSIEGAKVLCPDEIEVKTDGVFFCSTTLEGVDVKIHVRQLDETAAILSTFGKGTISTEKMRMRIEAELKAQIKIETTVDCGPSVRLSKPGSSFTCIAKDTKGVTAPIMVDVKDAEGSYSWKLDSKK